MSYLISGSNNYKFFVFIVVEVVEILELFFVCNFKGIVLVYLFFMLDFLIYDLLCLLDSELEWIC